MSVHLHLTCMYDAQQHTRPTRWIAATHPPTKPTLRACLTHVHVRLVCPGKDVYVAHMPSGDAEPVAQPPHRSASRFRGVYPRGDGKWKVGQLVRRRPSAVLPCCVLPCQHWCIDASRAVQRQMHLLWRHQTHQLGSDLYAAMLCWRPQAMVRCDGVLHCFGATFPDAAAAAACVDLARLYLFGDTHRIRSDLNFAADLEEYRSDLKVNDVMIDRLQPLRCWHIST